MTESQGGQEVGDTESTDRDAKDHGRDETVAYRLSGGELVRERDGHRETIATGETAVVVTDYRVQFVAGDPIVELSQADIQRIDIDSALLRKTRLVVTDWEDTTYRLPVSGDVSDAVAYVEQVSDCWQFVETLLEELEGQAATIAAHTENEAFEEARAVLSAAEETVAELEQRAVDAGLETTLGPRIRSASRDLQRARLRGRLQRARGLAEEARACHTGGKQQYDRAEECYGRAREQLESARSIAAEHDLSTDDIDEVAANLDNGMATLVAEPRTQAEQAVERAVGADPETRAEAFAEALSHYHDALSIGWGIDRDGDREHLRLCVELAAVATVRAHRDTAEEYDYEGDKHVMSGETERGCTRYREAQAHLETALALTEEFRGPVAEPLERRRDHLAEKCQKLGH